MTDKLIEIIIAIIIGFALISSGVSSVGSNFIMGLGLIVAGLAAIVLGVKVLM